MVKKYPKFFLGYFAIFLAEVLAITNGMDWLSYFSRPLITIFLMGFIITSLNHRGRFSMRIVVGLLFSLAGDVALLFPSDSNLYFVIGLLAFLLAHIAYIDAFYVDIKAKQLENPTNIAAPITVFFGLTLLYYVFLFSRLRELEIPVALYGAVTALMAVAAYLRYKKSNKRSYQLVLAGAIFLMFSDAVMAYHKFVNSQAWLEIVVVAIYMLAQLFITLGTVERKYRRELSKSK